MAASSRFLYAIATIATGCAQPRNAPIEPFFDDGKADGRGSKLALVEDFKVDIEEPSDLVFADGELYGISDRHGWIYRIDVTGSNDGDTDKVLDVDRHDLEALAWDGEHFLVGDESSGKVWRVSGNGDTRDPVELPDLTDGNSGIEGLTFDADGVLLVGKEKDPAQIFVVDGEDVSEHDVDFADDVSALSWNAWDAKLYALSDEEHALYRLNKDFEKTKAWRLPIEHPEGLAFDGDTVYVVSDSEARLYVFELD